MNSFLISVVICTYNRAALLANLLENLSAQSIDPSTYEIIIVDNNSLDQTRNVVEAFATSHGNVSYGFEACQGLSWARNHGYRIARGEYVAYLDDDWTVVTQDGKLSAQWEHTIAVTKTGFEILTLRDEEK